jgi:hypothetical protein
MGWGNPYINISNSAAVDRNPQIFVGDFIYYYQDFILVWESERNDNCQLWSSVFSMPMGGVGEDANTTLNARAYPNPFREFTSIAYDLAEPSKVQIMVYNGTGELIFKKDDPASKFGKQTFTWIAGEIPAGIYYAVIKSDEGLATLKLIKN